ncbi:MAG: hypothetical protein NW226_16635 [Microscillaceae bacterium]|nr:hypothetical protein [Microscillaceae bacterium]
MEQEINDFKLGDLGKKISDLKKEALETLEIAQALKKDHDEFLKEIKAGKYKQEKREDES